MRTLAALYARAERAIERKEEVVYDVAAERGQIVGNVAHMTWFKKAVAREITKTTQQWAHLEVPE